MHVCFISIVCIVLKRVCKIYEFPSIKIIGNFEILWLQKGSRKEKQTQFSSLKLEENRTNSWQISWHKPREKNLISKLENGREFNNILCHCHDYFCKVLRHRYRETTCWIYETNTLLPTYMLKATTSNRKERIFQIEYLSSLFLMTV